MITQYVVPGRAFGHSCAGHWSFLRRQESEPNPSFLRRQESQSALNDNNYSPVLVRGV